MLCAVKESALWMRSGQSSIWTWIIMNSCCCFTLFCVILKIVANNEKEDQKRDNEWHSSILCNEKLKKKLLNWKLVRINKCSLSTKIANKFLILS